MTRFPHIAPPVAPDAPVPQYETVPFAVGDPSDSRSERRKMTVTGMGPDDTRTLSLASPGFGRAATAWFKLRKWKKYQITLEHLATSPKQLRDNGRADYDWQATVDGQPGLPPDTGSSYFMVKNHWLADNGVGLLTDLRHGNETNPTDGISATLVPVDIDDNQPASGTDDISCTVEPGTGGRQEEHWIMAPAGPVPEDPSWGNTMRWNTPLPGAPRLDITTPIASPNPSHIMLDASRPAIDWRGASPVTIENTPSYLIGPGFGDIALPVKVKNMKKRNLKVAVHPVRSMASHEVIPLPDKAVFVSEFNRTFGWQLNLWLRDVDLDYKTEKLFRYGDMESDGTVLVYGVEHWKKLVRDHQDPGADVNIILVGSCSLMSSSHGGTVGAFNVGLTQLPTDIFPNTCVVLAIAKGCIRFSDQMISCIAGHETGHTIVGPGHPDQDAGPAPLQHSDRMQRLMHSESITKHYFGKRLVKKEWDQAEAWMKPNIDDKRP